jgi:hypothetical protein
VTEWQLSNGLRVILKPTSYKEDEILFRAVSPGGTSLAISKDGGLTWTGAFIPGVSKLSGGQLSFAGDNVASIDLDGNLFLITIGYSLPAGNLPKLAQLFSASLDGGQTFSAPLDVASSDAPPYPDKGWLAVNTFRDSPFVGRIAFTFTQTDDNSIAQTMFRYSDDQGRTWSNLKRVEFCAVSGQLPGPWCTHRTESWFIPGISPVTTCDVHREVFVDAATGFVRGQNLFGDFAEVLVHTLIHYASPPRK